MSVDEKLFVSLLNNIDMSQNKIKQIANQMMYYRDTGSARCLELWKRQFYMTNNSTKLQLLYVAHDVLIVSSRKNKFEYIKGFGDMFVTILRDFVDSADTFELLNALYVLCDSWETNMIYANNFMNVIRKFIREKQIILGSDDALGKESIIYQYKSDIRQICSNQISAKVLESKIDEMNLRFIYDNFDRDRIYKILDNFSDSINYEIEEAEEKLRGLRDIVASSLFRQEKVIVSLAELISKEKDAFFDYQNSI